MLPFGSLGPEPSAQGEPAVRARVLQQWLTFPERFDPAAATRLGEVVRESKRRAILDSAALAWIPIELDIEIVDAIAGVMGPRRFSAFSRAFFLDLMPRQPLGALLELGTKLMGLAPESFLKWWRKGWEAVYRNCGTVTSLVESDCRGRVIYEHMPEVCIRSDAFIEALLSSSYGIYTLTGTTGVVRVGARDPALGLLELEFEWRKKASLRGSV